MGMGGVSESQARSHTQRLVKAYPNKVKECPIFCYKYNISF